MPADLPPDLAAAFEGLELREHQPGCTFGIISERDLDVRLSCNCGVDEHNTRVDALAAQIAEKLIAQDRARTKAIDERLHVEQLIATRDAEHHAHVERLHRERDERDREIARLTDLLHPWYGPCDGFADGGACSECKRLGDFDWNKGTDTVRALRAERDEARAQIEFIRSGKMVAELDAYRAALHATGHEIVNGIVRRRTVKP